MSVFDQLLNAQTETELFVLLCSLTRTPTYRPLRAELASVSRGDGLALELTIRQGLKQRVSPKEVYLSWVVTHVFTLPAHGPLLWQMKDQPLLTGLEVIRTRLDQLRQSLDYSLLAEPAQNQHAYSESP